MLEHRKRDLTLTDGQETLPAVVFPAPWASSWTLADAMASPACPFLARKLEKRSQRLGVI